MWSKKKAHRRFDALTYRILIFRIAAGFGTLRLQVAGFHRAIPSTTLDKAYIEFRYTLQDFWEFVKTFLSLSSKCSYFRYGLFLFKLVK